MNHLESATDDPPLRNELLDKIIAFVSAAALQLRRVRQPRDRRRCLIGNKMIGAIGEVSAQDPRTADLAADVSHAALVAKLLAVGFGVAGAVGLIGAAVLRRRKRHVFVPIAAVVTVGGELALSISGGHVTSLDAIMVGCALFAVGVWYKLPRTLPETRRSAVVGRPDRHRARARARPST